MSAELLSVERDDLPRPSHLVNYPLATGLTCAPQFQIREPIVESVPIPMVNILIDEQWPSKPFGHNEAMLGGVSLLDRHWMIERDSKLSVSPSFTRPQSLSPDSWVRCSDISMDPQPSFMHRAQSTVLDYARTAFHCADAITRSLFSSVMHRTKLFGEGWAFTPRFNAVEVGLGVAHSFSSVRKEL